MQDNAERTSSFVVLINLLRPLDPSRWPSSETQESLADRNTKFSDLVVKCLIKLTKVSFSFKFFFWPSVIISSIFFYLCFLRVYYGGVLVSADGPQTLVRVSITSICRSVGFH